MSLLVFGVLADVLGSTRLAKLLKTHQILVIMIINRLYKVVVRFSVY